MAFGSSISFPRALCLFSLVLAVPAVAAPDLKLVAVAPEAVYPVAALGDAGIEIILPSGERGRVDVFRFELHGTASPSLELGYSPLLYEVNRNPANYERALRGGPLYDYNVVLAATTVNSRERWWNEIRLDEIWDSSALEEKGATFLLAWWNDGWKAVLSSSSGPSSLTYDLPLAAEDLPGRPILLLWRDGTWIPPRKYAQAVDGTDFTALQAGELPEEHGAVGPLDPFGLSWLHYASAWGLGTTTPAVELDPKTLRKAARKAPSPLAYAVLHGHEDWTRALLDAGFSTRDEIEELGFDTGQLAVYAGHRPVFETLVEAGYPLTRTADDGVYTPLSLALDFGRDDLTGLLLAAGVAPPRASGDHLDRLILRDASLGRANGLRAWLQDPPKKFAPGGEWTLLAVGTDSKNPAVVEVLLEAGADPNERTALPPLIIAATDGNLRAGQLLLAAGADPDAQSSGGNTALRAAVIGGHRDIVRLLLDAGADPNPPGKSGVGLAEIATLSNQPTVVADLFAAGAVCEMAPALAEEILLGAIRHDIVEMAALAFEQCVRPDFALYETYPVSWVADYYEASRIQAWWTERGVEEGTAAPVFERWSELDETPKALSTPLPGYSDEDFARYGRLELKATIVVDEAGQVRFPRLRGEIPQKLLLELQGYLAEWRFSAPTKEGDPVKTRIAIPLVFDRPPEPGEVFEMSEALTPPKAVRQALPIYPQGLKQRRIDGFVRIEFIISKEGRVREAKVLRSSHPFFSSAALAALEQWRFEPGTKDGEPVKVRVRISIPFKVH